MVHVLHQATGFMLWVLSKFGMMAILANLQLYQQLNCGDYELNTSANEDMENHSKTRKRHIIIEMFSILEVSFVRPIGVMLSIKFFTCFDTTSEEVSHSLRLAMHFACAH